MLFESMPLLFGFLPVLLILYFLTPTKYKNYILLIFSLIFYGWGNPTYIFIIIGSTILDYLSTIFMFNNSKRKRLYFTLSIIINISLLIFFSYSTQPMPLGVCFYSLKSIGYIIDVYKGKIKPEKNYFYYLTYISMFNTLLVGPINKYEKNDLYKRSIAIDKMYSGLIRFLNGLFKKVLIGDNIFHLWNIINSSNISSLSVVLTWLGIIAFTLKIYFDLSGYTDMAIGIGNMLGFDYKENFNYPYISKSITDFCSRFLITIKDWFKEYIYNTLGKKGTINILVVLVIAGIWFGSSVSFILFGLYYAIILIVEKFILKKHMGKWPNIIKHIYTILLVLIGWVLLSCNSLSNVVIYLKSMFGFNKLPFINTETLFYLKNYMVLLMIGIILCLPLKSIFKKTKFKKISIFRILLYIILFVITISYKANDISNLPLKKSLLNINTSIEKLIGKTEINGVYLGRDDYLISKYNTPVNFGEIASGLNNLFMEVNYVNMELMLIPTAIKINSDKLPIFTPISNQKEEMINIYNQVSFNTINIYDRLMEGEKHYQMFYKTSDYLTSYGAYYTYLEYCKSNNLEPILIDNYKIEEVTNKFFGNLYYKVNDYTKKSDSIHLFSQDNENYKVNYVESDKETDTLYELSYIEKDDKYSLFLDGNHPLIEITNKSINNKKELLVIKDSIGNTIVPFLTNHFHKVHVIDLNYYKGTVSDYIKEHKNIKDVLLIYNMNTVDENAGLKNIK